MPRKTPQHKGKAPEEDVPAAPGPRPDLTLLSRAYVLLEMGRALLEKDDFKAAAPVLEEAFSQMVMARAGPDDRIEALSSLSNLYIWAGNYDKSEAVALKAMDLICKYDSSVVSKGKANYIYGVALLKKADLDAGLKHLERALALFEAEHDKDAIANSCRHIGNVYHLRYIFSKAFVYYTRASKLYLELGREKELSIIQYNIALAKGYQGLYNEAIKGMELVIQNTQSRNDRSLSAMSHENLGYYHSELGHFDKALEHFEKGSQLASDIGDQFTEAFTYIGRIELLIAKGDIDEAQRLMDERYKHLMANKANLVMGLTLRVRGMIYRERGELKKAEDDLASAERLLAAGKHYLFIPTVLIELAKTAIKAKDGKRARELFGKARAKYKELKLPLREKELEKAMEQCGL